MLINNKTSPKSLSAKPMLLIYPRMYVRRLSGEFSRAIYMGETGFFRSTASPS